MENLEIRDLEDKGEGLGKVVGAAAAAIEDIRGRTRV